MDYYGRSEEYDPPDPMEEAREHAYDAGSDDGNVGGVSEENRWALEGSPPVRHAYLEGYHDHFIQRKEMEGATRIGPGRVLDTRLSLEGAGEMYHPRDHPYCGWTDTYTRS